MSQAVHVIPTFVSILTLHLRQDNGLSLDISAAGMILLSPVAPIVGVVGISERADA
jgi:hypothetical protein